MDQSQNHQLHGHSSPSLPGQQQQDSQLDPSAQNVLAEARKNLQVLIDSGISKDLLHQWVEDSPPLQLNFPIQSTLAAAQQSGSLHVPPQPQGPPPPPPSRSPSTLPSNASFSSNTNATSPSTASSTPTPTGGIHTEIKTEPRHDNAAVPWNAAIHDPSVSAQYMPIQEQPESNVFLPPSYPYAHRTRISVSSTSSGSSGHASLWSVNSARSSMSWQSNASNRSMGPPLTPASGAPVINGSQVTPSSGSKQNVYWCTSCETSFKRKYDWKRHEDEFHERWRKYPCPEPGCNRSFWGSNSFNQHHKQCHGCKTCPHAEKVVKFLRKRKYWACGFCSALHPARERHVEHVARHFESGLGKNDWMHSRVIYGLLHQPLIHTAWDTLVAEKHTSYGGRRPQFSWHPSKTGRAQGFLEKESPGQLQDLLEFFSGDEAEAQWIVSVAYDLADVVMTNNSNIQSPTASPSQQPTGSQPPQQQQQFSQDGSYGQMRPPSMLPSSTPGESNQAAFGAAQFRSSTVFPTSQQFQIPRQSSGSSSNSPLTMSPPVLASQASNYDKRELPPPPPPQGNSDSMMDFEYSPAPGGFGDWASMTNSMLASTPSQSGQTSTTQNGDWGMMGYFPDPRVTSA
ncbi:Zinc finger, C2H2-like protein [Akanthomyces lecanii RCEF 1005]|uniref:Zinc finger, C2H2-like protein n=1 Tax=Akanthomyces lecanii RCEF 1005 TaxID=1081108 RepID=A0A167YKL4_CORDF|nr:Zinc finger, C2H2-like protein [Akanthomyces lecanii RCEF 1005]